MHVTRQMTQRADVNAFLSPRGEISGVTCKFHRHDDRGTRRYVESYENRLEVGPSARPTSQKSRISGAQIDAPRSRQSHDVACCRDLLQNETLAPKLRLLCHAY